MKKRLDWIDLSKGIGIILMVLGHMPSMPRVIHDWIFTYHMPLFFFLSGYLFRKKNPKKCLKESAQSYLLPSVVYSALFIAIDYILFVDIHNIEISIGRFLSGQGSFDVLWFFVSMFWVKNVYNFIIEKASDEKKANLIMIIICIIAYCFTLFKIGITFKFMTSIVSVLFFASGYEYRQRDGGEFNKKKLGEKATGAFVINILCLATIYWVGWNVLDINSQQYGNLIITYVAAISGVLFIVYISRILENYRIMKPIIFIGENSLYFFPLTTYIPVRIVSLLELNGVTVNGIGKLLSKLIGFACTTAIVKIKNSIGSFINVSEKL